MRKFVLHGWALVASLVGAFVLGAAATIGFAFAVDDGSDSFTREDYETHKEISEKFDS